MKKIMMIICAILIFPAITHAQVQNTPSEVKNAFKANYPGVTSTKWYYNDGMYEADFKWEGRKYRSVYAVDGSWVEDYTQLKDNEIPAAVQDGFTASEYRYWNIDKVYRVNLPNEQTVYRYDIIYEDYNERLEMDEKGTIR